jgi:hypothetical protein
LWPGGPATLPGHGGRARTGFVTGVGVGAGVGRGVGREVGRGVAVTGVGVGRGVAGVAAGVGLIGGLVVAGWLDGPPAVPPGGVGVGVGTTATTTSLGEGSMLGLATDDTSTLGVGDGNGEPETPNGGVVEGSPDPAPGSVEAGAVAELEGGELRSAPAMPWSGWRGPTMPTASANDARTRLRTPSERTRRAR